MKSSSQLLVLGVLWPLSAAAADGAPVPAPLPDTSQWKCESCPAESGLSGSVEVGAGYVSKGSAKFGEYTGLDDKGGVLLGDGSASYRGKDGNYWNADASNLGLRSRSIAVEGGKQGSYKLLANYDEIPHLISDTAQTPFLGTGGASLTLPAGFGAPTTATMPLGTTLHGVDIGTERKRVGVGGLWMPARDWQYSLGVRHETKEGTQRIAGAFFVNTAQLVQPVDYVTDQLDAAVSYTGEKLQAKFAYYGSLFRNGNSSLTWQNPYTLLAGSPTAGQLALAPDNQFHQLVASGGYQLTDRTRVVADLAVGRMTQNDSFLAPTLNVGIAAPALPATSLDARANTVNGNVKLTSALSSKLRVNAGYSHNERENHTPQSLYSWVSTDMFLAGTRTNLPYSFRQDKLNLAAEYNFTPKTKTSVGFDHDEHQRTFQETDTTRDNTVWGKIASKAIDRVELSLKLSTAERRNSGYQQVTVGLVPTENPLLRKYNLANRTRDTAAVRADIAVTDAVNLGLGAAMSRDDYSDSTIGLNSGKDLNFNGDLSIAVTEQTSVHFFANREEIRSRQTGSESFSTPDWIGENVDTIDYFGLGVKHAAIKGKLDLGADYGSMRTRSEISVNTGTLSPFPPMTSNLDTIKLYATYRVKDNVALNASLWHERYDSQNWMLAGVTPGTIPNALAFGELPPRYTLNFLRLSVRYKF